MTSIETTQLREPSGEMTKSATADSKTPTETDVEKEQHQLLQSTRDVASGDAASHDVATPTVEDKRSNDSSHQSPAAVDRQKEPYEPPGANDGQSSAAHDSGALLNPSSAGSEKKSGWFRMPVLNKFRRGRENPEQRTLTPDQRKETVGINIVVFGETGVGKSSIINLIAGAQLARTSNAALGCTFGHEDYRVPLEETPFILWDTAGLDEGSEGTVPAEEAEKNLRILLEALSHSGGIHLVIYCIRGARLTKTLKHNYDLFYATICRRKVPVALVVTGLEHQKGGMESWWTQNVAELQRNGMRFDDHACVTSLGEDIQDEEIRRRRSESQTRLRELIQSYSKLPGWKVEESWFSKVSPLLRRLFQRIFSKDPEASAKARKVVVCGPFTGIFAHTTLVWDKGSCKIGNMVYDFLRVDKNSLRKITPEEFDGAGLIVFHASALTESRLEPTDVAALKELHDLAGGQGCPVMVILKDCNDKGVAWDCRQQITSTHREIRPNVVISSDAEEKMIQTVELFYLEPIEGKDPTASEKTRRKGKN